MRDFVTPDFLKNRSANEFHKLMKEILPKDIDISQGGHEWNFTRPTALVAAEICEFILPEVIKLIFPEWSYGEFLDNHAARDGIVRRAATFAPGEITVTGSAKTIIPKGSLFSTASINEEPSVDYKTTSTATVPSSGSVTIPIECTKAGIVGNTAANTIVLVSSKLTGITSVTNEKAITGGTEEESDESLYERISAYEKNMSDSFVGTLGDYKRWAESVPGVGEAVPIPPEDESGIVTIIITDSNGAPANEKTLSDVYNHIMKPDKPYERLAPTNAILSVVAPSTIPLSIKATIELDADATIESVQSDLLLKLTTYFAVALDEGEIKYTRVSSVLSDTEGVADFKDLQIGIASASGTTYSTSNIPITDRQLPTVDAANIVLTSGTV